MISLSHSVDGEQIVFRNLEDGTMLRVHKDDFEMFTDMCVDELNDLAETTYELVEYD